MGRGSLRTLPRCTMGNHLGKERIGDIILQPLPCLFSDRLRHL